MAKTYRRKPGEPKGKLRNLRKASRIKRIGSKYKEAERIKDEAERIYG